MKKITGIYKITSPSNKVYVGQSIDILSRWNYHYKKYRCKSQRHLYNSLLKYGHEAHIFEVLEECKRHELNDLEKHYIIMYKATDKTKGLNHREGGNGRIISESTRMRMSKASMGNTNMLGRKHSEETRLKISTNRKGIYPSDETKRKMSVARVGVRLSEETKTKISRANKYTRKIENTATNVKYNSITEASIIEKISQSTIYRGLKDGRYEYIN